jgi:hypothetical protein
MSSHNRRDREWQKPRYTRSVWVMQPGTLTPPVRATTATIRRKLVTVPARIATTARRLHLHLPAGWPWQTAWLTLYQRLLPYPATAAT